MYNLIKKIKWRFFWQYAIVFVLLGLLDLIIFDFSLQRLLTADFWTNMLVNMTAMILMFNTSTDQTIEKIIEKDEWIKEAEKALLTFSVEKGLDFEDYVAEVNFWRKRDAYISQLEAELQNLKVIPRFNPFRPFARRKRLKDLELWGLKNEEIKRKNYYCIQRKELEERLEWIKNTSRDEVEKYLMSVNVKYDQLTESAVLVNKTYITKNEFESSAHKKIRDNFGQFIYILVYSVFIAGLSKDSIGFTQITPSILFNYLSKTWMLLKMYHNGVKYAPKFVDEHIKDHLQKRLNHVKGYWSWKEKHKNVKSEVKHVENHKVQNQYEDRLLQIS